MGEQYVGEVIRCFGNAGMAVIKINEWPLRVGDTIHVVGRTSDFMQTVDSMQSNGTLVQVANGGDEIAVQLVKHAECHDEVFVVVAVVTVWY